MKMKLGAAESAEQLINRCEEYLTSFHTVLYGQYWDVTDDEQRREAAVWLAEQINGVAALEYPS
jgi:hypothetical protein